MANQHILPGWIGSIFTVKFLDHTENESTPALVQAIGRLISIEPDFIRLRAWATIPKADPTCQMEWCIIRSAITSMIRLQEIGDIY